MAMIAKIWSLNALATELGRDRRAVGNALANVPPDGKASRGDGWLMKTAVSALYEGKTHSLQEEKARLTREQADKTEMENRLRRREVLERGLVDQAVIGAFARVRARLLSIPSKLAPRIARGMDPSEAEGILRDSIHESLRELADTDVAKLDDDDGDLVEGSDAAP